MTAEEMERCYEARGRAAAAAGAVGELSSALNTASAELASAQEALNAALAAQQQAAAETQAATREFDSLGGYSVGPDVIARAQAKQNQAQQNEGRANEAVSAATNARAGVQSAVDYAASQLGAANNQLQSLEAQVSQACG